MIIKEEKLNTDYKSNNDRFEDLYHSQNVIHPYHYLFGVSGFRCL